MFLLSFSVLFFYSKPKYIQEKRREEEEAKAQLDMQLTQEAAYATMAKDTSNKVSPIL